VPSIVDSKDKFGKTALHLAVVQQNVDVVATLLADGKADVNAVTDDGLTALHIAASTYQSGVNVIKLFAPVVYKYS
jgi:ankyrin repeat protein